MQALPVVESDGCARRSSSCRGSSAHTGGTEPLVLHRLGDDEAFIGVDSEYAAYQVLGCARKAACIIRRGVDHASELDKLYQIQVAYDYLICQC